MKYNYSSYGIYSLFCKIKFKIKNRKEDYDIYKLVRKSNYNNSCEYVIRKTKLIFNDICNHYYTFNQFVMYITYYHLVNNKFPNFGDINKDNIKNMMRIFTKKQYKNDLDFVNGIINKLNLKGKNQIIKSLIPLVKDKYISPKFFIKILSKDFLTKEDENDIFNNKELEQFLFDIKTLQTILSEVINEQKKVHS